MVAIGRSNISSVKVTAVLPLLTQRVEGISVGVKSNKWCSVFLVLLFNATVAVEL